MNDHKFYQKYNTPDTRDTTVNKTDMTFALMQVRVDMLCIHVCGRGVVLVIIWPISDF